MARKLFPKKESPITSGEPIPQQFESFIPRPAVFNSPTPPPTTVPLLGQQSTQVQEPQYVQSQSQRGKFFFFRKPIFKTVIATISANVNGQRVELATRKVRTLDGTFRFMRRAFIIDLSKAFLISRRGAHIMYDWNYSEPVEKTVNGEILQSPVILGDTVHYSKETDTVLNQGVIEQIIRAVGRKSGFDMMTIIMMIIGICVGLPIGIIIGQRMLTPAVVTTVTNTTTTNTAKMLIGIARMWLRI